ncbi:MAG: 3-hydroxybutyryl-CoA dehydrogenase [Rhodospirillaceae bacterium]|jgi:3-hydroxybutyryl-CoA dehydrogenase|nr:3-hydroxybutyryl-CoA dehydrogenase [Rhodospirillaceae bacterium]MBT5081146.1 3-hydroxybutyryl-CoA dehydrogenase [Rhodospirillaceae bacterium]MBT5524673.1 3-hydroxybutyryl-CoA dehydrogenase [Rhodospirillaceae bacterium]MBT5880098.1 3-hydroxybutyryl-CoA dehydrogenase [Rhodospirillaceae bacterium]MBT6588788.1 3-hydroxybutyryl-CoA dehydrogenase [Rhodospirillaceae bacterium]
MADDVIKHVAAIGAGRMGRGIAHVFAYAGYRVTLADVKPRRAAEHETLLTAARAEIEGNLKTLAEFGAFDGALIPAMLARIHFTADLSELGDADLIFEGVTETMEAKEAAFAALKEVVGAAAIIASTTSTLPVDKLAAFVDRPERFLNAHWLNPAYLIPLVEVSPGAATRDDVVDTVRRVLEGIGKVPVVCAPTPGYIIPRIQAVAMNEAARMVEEGVASAADIDKAIRTGFGPRYSTMGLLEFVDVGGGDILYHASRYLAQNLGSDRYNSPQNVLDNMEQGRRGLRDGKGFYDFEAMDVPAYQRDQMARFVSLFQHLDLLPPPGKAD